MDARDPSRRIADNPFYVLGLPPDCTRARIEREGQKLLGMLQVGLSQAKTYTSPLGEHPRTSESVREAMSELRDPERRLRHELWARLSPHQAAGAIGSEPATQARCPTSPEQTGQSARPPAKQGWRDARVRLGWRRA